MLSNMNNGLEYGQTTKSHRYKILKSLGQRAIALNTKDGYDMSLNAISNKKAKKAKAKAAKAKKLKKNGISSSTAISTTIPIPITKKKQKKEQKQISTSQATTTK